MQKKQALIALGSNIGNREEHLKEALVLLEKEVGTLLKTSKFVNTAPVGGPPQEDYLNAAVTLETTLSPEELLKQLLKIEQKMGRKRIIRWGPRTIDLDIIFYEQEVMDRPKLTIPHPRVHERLFVLEPAIQVAPDWNHPVFNQTLQELYQKQILEHSS